MSRKVDKRWIVKDANARIQGPFTTEQILERIDKNYFLGGEEVALYPGGSWISISTAPEFYDRLLDVLDAEVKQSAQATLPLRRSNQQKGRSNIPPAGARAKAPDSQSNPVPEQPLQVEDTKSVEEEMPELGEETKNAIQQHEPVIELVDLKRRERNKQLKQSKLPLILIVAGLGLALSATFLSSGGLSGDKRVHLLMPRSKQAELPDAKRKEKFGRARTAFESDTFDGYQKAENELVEIIEGAPNRIEAAASKAEYLSFLCMTYRELWPFAKQDSKDLKALAVVTQEAKRLDPGGLHGSLCELVTLTLAGKLTDAQGLADSVLRDKGLVAPVLIELRGDLFMQAKDPQTAVGYFSQAHSIWAAWQKSAVEEARARSMLSQYPAAMQLYHGVLLKSPDHGVAKIELGLIEASQFNQYEKGLTLINSGLTERVPRSVEARGYLGVAQIYMRKQQKARAREAAKHAYELDPGNREAKELLVSLGGDSKLKGGETDLMFLGEQYMRGGDFFSAQAQFKAAFEANPKNGIAAMKAGKCLWQLNQTGDAIDWMRRATRADPQLISAYVELADYYAQRFDYFAANDVLKQAQGRAPNSFEVYRGFATVELRRNNYQGAIAYGQKALKLYETDAETLLLMAKASLGNQAFPEAQKFAARAIDLDYNNTEAHSLYAKIEAGLHGVNAGAAYIQQMLNRYVITRGQQVPQAAIDLRVTLGEIYMQDERLKPAEEAFKQAIALDPNARKALIDLGKVLQAETQTSLALEQFLKAAVLDPSDPEPIFFAGKLYADSGNLVEAMKQLERVLRINPRYPRAHSEIGRVALKRGDAKRALEEAMLERATNPDLADAYTLAAEAYFSQHQYSACASEYQKAVSKHAPGALVLVRMARCFRLTGALESAQSLLRQAISIESGNPDIYKEQGAIFHTKGMADEAITAYDTYIHLAPNAADRAEVEMRIRRVQGGDLNVGE